MELALKVGIKLHPSDKIGFGIMIGGLLLIGGTFLLFRVFGDSYLIALLALMGWIVLIGFIGKFFGASKRKIKDSGH